MSQIRPIRSVALLTAVLVAVGALSVTDERAVASAEAVVSLTTREPEHAMDTDAPPPFLARELIRQAFLIAARDECGLSTRDKSLREEYPAATDPQLAAFVMSCSVARV